MAGPVIALVAAAGTEGSRFGRLRIPAEATGHDFREVTPPDSQVRLGVLSPGERAGEKPGARNSGEGPDLKGTEICGALGLTRDRRSTLAALGSGLHRLGSAGLRRLLDSHRQNPSAFLDGAPQDLAVLVADGKKGTLTLGTTPGNQRLFLAETEGGILASTRLTFVADALGEHLRVDRSYEDFLLGFGFLPDDRTVYEGIRVLPTGLIREWPAAPRAEIQHAGSEGMEDTPSSGREVHDLLHDAFFRALEDQARGRRRHAVLLGGFDSALVAAGLRRLGHEVHTYTFAFGDPRYEQQHAERIAGHLGARHHPVKITPEIIEVGLESFSDIFNQPAPQPHYQLHTAHACRLAARDRHDHIFTGDGCDSAFLSYPTVSLRSRVLECVAVFPHRLRRTLLMLAASRGAERRLGHVARMVRSTLRSLDLPQPARGHLPTQYLDAVALTRLRSGPVPPQRESVSEVRERLARALSDLDPVELAFHGNSLVGQSGSKVEGSIAVSGLPQLSPYRDPMFRSLARKLRGSVLAESRNRPASERKAPLHDMARRHDLLPDYAIDMPKESPVDSPVDRWYAGPLRPLVYRLLDDLPFECDRRYVDEILAPKRAEEVFRNRISLGHHAFQAIGLLCSYATFTGRAG